MGKPPVEFAAQNIAGIIETESRLDDLIANTDQDKSDDIPFKLHNVSITAIATGPKFVQLLCHIWRKEDSIQRNTPTIMSANVSGKLF